MPEPRRTANRRPGLSDDLRRIITAYAVITEHRAVLLCEPRAFELGFYPHPGNPKWTGNNGKVCYPDKLAAGLAAEAIGRLPEADEVVAYACPRGGHWHHQDAARARRVAASIIRDITAAARRAGSR